MELELRSIGSFNGNPAKIIELTIDTNCGRVTEDITDNESFVDYDFIQNLREIADELEEHNQEVANKTKF